jgi:hypothetical protein
MAGVDPGAVELAAFLLGEEGLGVASAGEGLGAFGAGGSR